MCVKDDVNVIISAPTPIYIWRRQFDNFCLSTISLSSFISYYGLMLFFFLCNSSANQCRLNWWIFKLCTKDSDFFLLITLLCSQQQSTGSNFFLLFFCFRRRIKKTKDTDISPSYIPPPIRDYTSGSVSLHRGPEENK